MCKQGLVLVFTVLVPLIPACRSLETREYAPQSSPVPDSQHRIVAVTRSSGELITFDRGGDVALPRFDGEAVVGPVDGEPVRVEFAETRTISMEERDNHVGRTLLLLGVTGFAAAMAIALATTDAIGY
jgi:hypothetical protein